MDQVLVLGCKQLELGKNKLSGVQEEEDKETNSKIIFLFLKFFFNINTSKQFKNILKIIF
jgi:hypothetical protein